MPRMRPIGRPASRVLPANVTDLLAQRVVKRTVTLLDEVEQAMTAIYDEPQYMRFREAIDNGDAVEGSIFADDIVSAQMIRKKAEVLGLHQVEEADLTLIAQKLRAAERRFNASRKQRKNAPETPPAAPASEAEAPVAAEA